MTSLQNLNAGMSRVGQHASWVRVQCGAHRRKRHPAQVARAEQVKGPEGRLVAHLGASVDVVAEVVVVQGGAAAHGLTHPGDLLQGGQRAQRQPRQVRLPEEVTAQGCLCWAAQANDWEPFSALHAGEAGRQDVYDADRNEDACKGPFIITS